MSAQEDVRAAAEQALAKKGRMVSLVIAGTMVLWVIALAVGPMLGLPGRFALLFDFAALAALFWALVVSFQIRRARKDARAQS